MQRMQFNTVASAAMKMLNALYSTVSTGLETPDRAPGAFQFALYEGMSILLRLLTPSRLTYRTISGASWDSARTFSMPSGPSTTPRH